MNINDAEILDVFLDVDAGNFLRGVSLIWHPCQGHMKKRSMKLEVEPKIPTGNQLGFLVCL